MCFYNYTIRSLFPSSMLSKSIEKNTGKLKTTITSIKDISVQIKSEFEQLKKANIELTKLAVYATKLKEKPKIKDFYKQNEEAVSKINKSISSKITHLFNKIDFATKILEKIIFNADAVIYKESKGLNNLIKQIQSLEDKKLSQMLLNKINLVKEDIKTAARRLYEASRAEEEVLEKYPEKSKKTIISEEIKKFGIETAKIESVLKKLTLNNIDQITENAEKLLNDLKKIELDVIIAINKLEEHFDKINPLLYLLEEDIAYSIKKKSNSSKELLTNTKKRITEHAKNLLKDIEIVKKIK
ncbi:hypothetical protein KY342_05625 [Candidatus Woesearchaeota archaeon]|nr:hypothetical protein [Candidatus Woesearchaeota archaeon]